MEIFIRAKHGPSATLKFSSEDEIKKGLFDRIYKWGAKNIVDTKELFVSTESEKILSSLFNDYKTDSGFMLGGYILKTQK